MSIIAPISASFIPSFNPPDDICQKIPAKFPGTNYREKLTEIRQPLQVQSHLEMSGILVQLGHIQRT